MNPKVDAFLKAETKWREEFTLLRKLILECDLVEDLKWGQPCYSLDGKNVVLMHGFKEYCALLFHKGVLLKDPEGILVQQTKNVQVARQIRFTNAQQIVRLKKTLKAYVQQAIEVERSGKKAQLKSAEEFELAEEFKRRLDSSAPLKAAFSALTPGRRRAYLLFFSQAKQAETRESRVDKCIPRILKGLGMND
jgi:uncharacterized protein YdeI (YjbR/CyaY-like superfamily)